MAPLNSPQVEEAVNYFDAGSGCTAEIHREPSPEPPFRFVDLPGEIQNVIVNEFIIAREPVVIRKPRFNRHESPPPKPIARPRFDRPVVLMAPSSRSSSAERNKQYGHSRLALMLTCKQLYREHWRTYYGENTFVFNMDVFRDYAHNMPSRCWQHIRKLAIRMPHRHHHEGVWKMFGTMGCLEWLQLWMSPSIATDETVREAAIDGIKGCRQLKSFKVRRLGDVENGDFAELTETDLELQDHISSLLKARATKKPMRKECRPRKLKRRLTDPFIFSPSNEESEIGEE